MAERYGVETRRSGLERHRALSHERPKKASFRRLRAWRPERPAPRARAPPPPRSPSALASPPPAGARAPQHCCSHRPTARSACRQAYVKVPGALLPERPPRARARGSPRSPAPSPHPLQRRARPLTAALPVPRPWALLHLHSCSVYACSHPPVPQRRARRSTLSPCTAPSAHSPFPGNRARFVAGRRRRRLR